MDNISHKYKTTFLNTYSYFNYLQNKNNKNNKKNNTKLLFRNMTITDMNNSIFNYNEYKSNRNGTGNGTGTGNIDALLIFILDGEVLDILEKKNYIAIVFDYSFKDEYNLINCLPSKIKFIEFDSYSSFNKPIDNYPPELEYLILSPRFNNKLDYLPYSLKYLKLYLNYLNSNSLANLPSNIEFLDIEIISNTNDNTNDNVDYHNDNAINYLPDNIKVLVIGCNIEINIEKLPRYLEVFQSFNSYGGINLNMKEFMEMQKIMEIYFPFKFNKSIDYNNVDWPDTIKFLSFGEEFNQPIHNLPKYLEILEVGTSFNLEEHIILADVKFPTTLKTFNYIDRFPKQQETINLLNEIRLLYPEIQFIHK